MTAQLTPLLDLFSTARLAPRSAPWPRYAVDEDTWDRAALWLTLGEGTLLSVWGHGDHVHMALRDNAAGNIAIASLACARGRFPSVSRHHPPALRLERTIQDLWGLRAFAIPDGRPWLDHGRWPIQAPLGLATSVADAAPYEFLPVEGASLHQIPVGPVHAGIIEPGHFRFTANGETVVRLEERLGYVHKGIDKLMAGAGIVRAAKLAGRVSGDSTVAYALAFARAIEAASGLELPERAHWLRALMAELERLANHFGDIGAIANDAAFALMHTHCGILREQVLRAAHTCFGQRLMMDCVIPGGVARELANEGIPTLRELIKDIRRSFPELVELYDNTASLQDRTVGTGIVSTALVNQYGAGGYVGRASGRNFDARRDVGYAPYHRLNFEVPLRAEGDVDARVWIRIREVEASTALIEQILGHLAPGPIREPLPTLGETREGAALIEGFRGDIFAWLRIGVDGAIERCHLRDPSWFQWPLLEAAIEGNIVADFPLCNKSFNCSYSGADL